MDAPITLDGRTRIAGIIGDPIAQVKSPAAVTRRMQAAGHNLVLVPMHVASADLDRFFDGIGLLRNLDGLVVTVPHKFAACRRCSIMTERARFLGAVNVMRRGTDGGWHGDMVDGLGFVNGLRAAGIAIAGRRALLVGAGGAGSAIGLALIEAGVAALTIHDADPARAAALVERLRTVAGAAVGTAPTPDPAGHGIIVNATPVGMREGDPFPVLVEHLTGEMAVCDVITAPERTPLLEEAARRGCTTQTGAGMYFGLLDLLAEFLASSS